MVDQLIGQVFSQSLMTIHDLVSHAVSSSLYETVLSYDPRRRNYLIIFKSNKLLVHFAVVLF